MKYFKDIAPIIVTSLQQSAFNFRYECSDKTWNITRLLDRRIKVNKMKTRRQYFMNLSIICFHSCHNIISSESLWHLCSICKYFATTLNYFPIMYLIRLFLFSPDLRWLHASLEPACFELKLLSVFSKQSPSNTSARWTNCGFFIHQVYELNLIFRFSIVIIKRFRHNMYHI